MLDKVVAFTDDKRLFSAPCHVLLGLSGGADSMALLHVLTHWPVAGLRVSAVHIHHGLRESADRDEAFVREYCAHCGVSLTVIHEDVAAVATDQRLSLEEAGRRVRYEQFEAVRESVGADAILTAHTAADQAETVLMHLIRGCGVDGLSGIPCARGAIRRPLLCCDRREIEAYCAENQIPFITDETNFDTKYTRNDVRHRVLPLLREINPAVDNALLRVSKCAAEDAAYLNALALDALQAAVCDGGYRAEAFVSQSSVIRRRMIRLMMRQSAVPVIEEAHILAAESAVRNGEGAVDLPDFFSFVVQQGVVAVRKTTTSEPSAPLSICAIPCTVTFGEQEFSFAIYDDADENVYKMFFNCVMDYDKIQGGLRLRCRQSGDYFRAAGRGVGKSLKKWMNEWHIPAHLRDAYPVLCDDAGVVLVPGYACDERVRTTEATKHFLVCKTEAE